MITCNRELLKPRSGNSYRRCPKDWMCQPKVNDHRVAIMLHKDGDRHIVFSNDGTLYTKGELKPEWVRELHAFFSKLDVDQPKGDWPWLVDGGVMGPAYGQDPHALIMRDLPKLPYTYKERTSYIKKFPCWMLYGDPNHGVFHLPDHNPVFNTVHWVAMQEHNQEIDHHLYEGLVCKDPESEYPFQTNKKSFPSWVKYRFDQLN